MSSPAIRILSDAGRMVRHAVRALRRTPGATGTALATLALCLGVNLTIFAVVDTVLLRPLPFPDADRLVRVYNTYPNAGVMDDGASITNYYERRGRIDVFSSLAEYREVQATIGEPGATSREPVMQVSPDLFSTLGVVPVAGREFVDADMTPADSLVAVITDAYWRRSLDAAPDAIGRTVRINGRPHTIVGLLPPGFRFLSSRAAIYLPRASTPEQRSPDRRHNGSSTQMVARLTPGATIAQAESALQAHNDAVEGGNAQAQFMRDAGFRTVVVSLHGDHVASARQLLLLIQGAAMLLLLIGGGNLVNLLLIRASGRAKEFAVRDALGAGAVRIGLEVLAEIMILTLAGGVLGLGAGAAGTRLLALVGAERLPLGAYVGVDARLALLALAATMVVGLIVGLPVAWHCARQRLAEGMSLESRGTTTNRSVRRARHAFVTAQVAMAFVLLSATGLLALSLNRASAERPGFRPDHVLSGQVSIPATDFPDGPSVATFTERLSQAIAAQPGVHAVGLATNIPLSGMNIMSAATPVLPGVEKSPQGHFSYGVRGDYFEAMGLTLINGRFLTDEDSSRPARVAVVDEDFARHYWPDSSAIGQRVVQGGQRTGGDEAFTIVGVVAPARQIGVTQSDRSGAIYYPLPFRLDRDLYLVTRAQVDPNSLIPVIQHAVRALDPHVSLSHVRPMDSLVADSLMTYRSPVLLVALFATGALLLTALGTYGVLSHAAGQRRREIAVRAALGAQPRDIRWEFISIAIRMLAMGLVVGAGGSWLAGQVMQAILFQVPQVEAWILIGTAVVLAAVSLAACIVPALRASRISPIEALTDR